MESIQSSGVEEESGLANKENGGGDSGGTRTSESRDKSPTVLKKKRKKTEPTFDFAKESPHDKYSKELNSDSDAAGSLRAKRAVGGRNKENEKKNTCSLFIQTDPLIWRHISEQVRS